MNLGTLGFYWFPEIGLLYASRSIEQPIEIEIRIESGDFDRVEFLQAGEEQLFMAAPRGPFQLEFHGTGIPSVKVAFDPALAQVPSWDEKLNAEQLLIGYDCTLVRWDSIVPQRHTSSVQPKSFAGPFPPQGLRVWPESWRQLLVSPWHEKRAIRSADSAAVVFGPCSVIWLRPARPTISVSFTELGSARTRAQVVIRGAGPVRPSIHLLHMDYQSQQVHAYPCPRDGSPIAITNVKPKDAFQIVADEDVDVQWNTTDQPLNSPHCQFQADKLFAVSPEQLSHWSQLNSVARASSSKAIAGESLSDLLAGAAEIPFARQRRGLSLFVGGSGIASPAITELVDHSCLRQMERFPLPALYCWTKLYIFCCQNPTFLGSNASPMDLIACALSRPALLQFAAYRQHLWPAIKRFGRLPDADPITLRTLLRRATTEYPPVQKFLQTATIEELKWWEAALSNMTDSARELPLYFQLRVEQGVLVPPADAREAAAALRRIVKAASQRFETLFEPGSSLGKTALKAAESIKAVARRGAEKRELVAADRALLELTDAVCSELRELARVRNDSAIRAEFTALSKKVEASGREALDQLLAEQNRFAETPNVSVPHKLLSGHKAELVIDRRMLQALANRMQAEWSKLGKAVRWLERLIVESQLSNWTDRDDLGQENSKNDIKITRNRITALGKQLTSISDGCAGVDRLSFSALCEGRVDVARLRGRLEDESTWLDSFSDAPDSAASAVGLDILGADVRQALDTLTLSLAAIELRGVLRVELREKLSAMDQMALPWKNLVSAQLARCASLLADPLANAMALLQCLSTVETEMRAHSGWALRWQHVTTALSLGIPDILGTHTDAMLQLGLDTSLDSDRNVAQVIQAVSEGWAQVLGPSGPFAVLTGRSMDLVETFENAKTLLGFDLSPTDRDRLEKFCQNVGATTDGRDHLIRNAARIRSSPPAPRSLDAVNNAVGLLEELIDFVGDYRNLMQSIGSVERAVMRGIETALGGVPPPCNKVLAEFVTAGNWKFVAAAIHHLAKLEEFIVLRGLVLDSAGVRFAHLISGEVELHRALAHAVSMSDRSNRELLDSVDGEKLSAAIESLKALRGQVTGVNNRHSDSIATQVKGLLTIKLQQVNRSLNRSAQDRFRIPVEKDVTEQTNWIRSHAADRAVDLEVLLLRRRLVEHQLLPEEAM